jgi:hypothetical protein
MFGQRGVGEAAGGDPGRGGYRVQPRQGDLRSGHAPIGGDGAHPVDDVPIVGLVLPRSATP